MAKKTGEVRIVEAAAVRLIVCEHQRSGEKSLARTAGAMLKELMVRRKMQRKRR